MEDVNKGIKLYQEFKIDEAKKVFLELEEQDSNNIDVLNYLGKIYSKYQDYGIAINYFNRVLDLDKYNSTAQIGLQLIKNILALTNNYYYENPYTDDELYEND